MAQTGLALMAAALALAFAEDPHQGVIGALAVLGLFALVNPVIGFFADHWWRYTMLSTAGIVALAFAVTVLGAVSQGVALPGPGRMLRAVQVPLGLYLGMLGLTGACRFAHSLAQIRAARTPEALARIIPEPVLFGVMASAGLLVGATAFFAGYELMDRLSEADRIEPLPVIEDGSLQGFAGAAMVEDRRLVLALHNTTTFVLTEITLTVAPVDPSPVHEPFTVIRDLFADPWPPGARREEVIVLPENWEGRAVTWQVSGAKGGR